MTLASNTSTWFPCSRKVSLKLVQRMRRVAMQIGSIGSCQHSLRLVQPTGQNQHFAHFGSICINIIILEGKFHIYILLAQTHMRASRVRAIFCSAGFLVRRMWISLSNRQPTVPTFLLIPTTTNSSQAVHVPSLGKMCIAHTHVIAHKI